MDILKSALAMLALCGLSGCISLAGAPVDRPGMLAHWDGLGPAPTYVVGNARRPRLSSGFAQPRVEAAPPIDLPNPFKPYSKEWWEIQDRNARAEDARMSRLLVICRGCVVDRDLIPPIKREPAVGGTVHTSHLAPSLEGNALPSGEK